MKASKNIKVYGTLVNGTIDYSLQDNTHNDALVNAFQVYDERFGDTPNASNFLDVINKRLTDIKYGDGTTVIENRNYIAGDHYTLEVKGDTNIEGDLNVTGDTNIGGELHVDNISIEGNKDIDISLDQLKDVNVPGPTAKDILYYQNGIWKNGNIITLYNTELADFVDEHSPRSLRDLDDVEVASRKDSQFLKHIGSADNSANDKWIAAYISISDIAGISGLDDAEEGDVLKYIGGEWKPGKDIDTTGARWLYELRDTNLSQNRPSAGKMLVSDGTNWIDKTAAEIWEAERQNINISLNDLADVNIPASVANGAALIYDSATSKWIPGTPTAPGATSLNELSDVTISSVAGGQVLQYDSSSSQWKNKKLSLSDITLPNATSGQVLKYNGTDWVAANDEQGSGGSGGGSDYEVLEVSPSGMFNTDALSYFYYTMPITDAHRVVSVLCTWTKGGGVNLGDSSITAAVYNTNYTLTYDDQSYTLTNCWYTTDLLENNPTNIKFKFLMKKATT